MDKMLLTSKPNMTQKEQSEKRITTRKLILLYKIKYSTKIA
jgi:hypothetical protein